MNLLRNPDSADESPVSRRDPVSILRIGIGLFGAPIAWIIQFSLSEPLSAQACYPHLAPLSAPIWAGLPVMLAIISILCTTAALFSGLVAWLSWRRSATHQAGMGEKAGASGSRNRFLLTLGMMSSFIFIVAIIFNLCAVLLVSPCSSW
jgi:hypothetical protein